MEPPHLLSAGPVLAHTHPLPAAPGSHHYTFCLYEFRNVFSLLNWFLLCIINFQYEIFKTFNPFRINHFISVNWKTGKIYSFGQRKREYCHPSELFKTVIWKCFIIIKKFQNNKSAKDVNGAPLDVPPVCGT